MEQADHSTDQTQLPASAPARCDAAQQRPCARTTAQEEFDAQAHYYQQRNGKQGKQPRPGLALLDATALESLQRKTAGATRERMLRELAEALEALTVERPLVLWFEDLHWSDTATLEWLAFVARRRKHARVLIIGSYRPVEMLRGGHPLKGVLHELYAHQLGQELTLQRLMETEVNTYLTLRFPESILPARLGAVLQHRTGGNPLFLASLVQELLTRRVIYQEADDRWVWQGELAELERWTPESMRHVLARQRERLTPDEQRLLEAASLAGQEFSTATVAAALETEAAQIEDHCGQLAEQQQFLRRVGISAWPDGTRAERYGFLHALYQEFWHERVSVGHQQQWHLRMGERKEAAYGQRAGEIAAELALHFEQGREYSKAVRYLRSAGENAVQRSAYQEAINYFTKGLGLLETWPNPPERPQHELTLQLALSGALMTVKGYTAAEVEKIVLRTQELYHQLEETPQLFPVLYRQWTFYFLRGEVQTALELAKEAMRLAQSGQDQYFLSLAHNALGWTLYQLGELTLARPNAAQVLALYDPQKHPRSAVNALDPRVDSLSYTTWALWLLGYPDQALKKSQETLTLAAELTHPFSLAYALGSAALLHCFRREGLLAQERAEAVMALSTEQGFPFWLAWGNMVQGWVLTEQGQLQEGINRMNNMRAPFTFALLAEAYGKVGQWKKGLTVLAEALASADKTGLRVGEAELYRIKGTLTVQLQIESYTSKVEEAEACFLKAIEIARRQQAKSLELRAVMSLARLWQHQGKQNQARGRLAKIYNWFIEGFDTVDLQEAKALLETLA